MADGETTLTAAWPGIRDEQAATVLGNLPPTARRILEAAYRVLERDGYEALSLRRIAHESGETRSLILYHFHSKAGLVATLVDSLWHDEDVALVDEVRRLGSDPRGRLLALTGLHRRFAEEPRLYLTLFNLLPHIIRDGEARARMSRTYRSYRRIGELCLAPGPARGDALALATLLLAIGEGIAVEVMLTGDSGILAPAFATLERRALRHLGLEPAADGSAADGSAAEGSAAEEPAAEEPAAEEPAADGSAADRRAGVGPPVPRAPLSQEAGPPADPLEGLEDPAAGLTPAGARVLEAAVALTTDEGLRAVTAEALARASGEPSSSVLYYFGDKRGLVAAVVASSDYRFGRAVAKAARRAVPGHPPPAALARVLHNVFRQPGWMRLLFEVLPVVLRDDELRAREALFTEHLRAEPAALLRSSGADEDEASRLALLSQSLVLGLAIQKLVDPRGTPVTAAIDVWQALLEQQDPGPAQPSSKA